MFGDGGKDSKSTIVDLSAVEGFPVGGIGGIGEGVDVVSIRAAN